MSKKSRKAKVPVIPKEKLAKLALVTDTSFLGLGKTSLEGVYNVLEAEGPTIIQEGRATTDSNKKLESTVKELASSYLHKIAARANVFPYNDLVRWVIESINITDTTFFTSGGRMFGSFKEKYINKLYHLPNLHKI